MPAAPVVPGVEFQSMSVGNWDGTTTTTWVTVAGTGRFTVRWDNGAAVPVTYILHRATFADVSVTLAPGAGTFDAGNRQWTDWSNVEIGSAPRPTDG